MGNEADIVANLHKVYAHGVCNTFGYDWGPLTGQLWLEEDGDNSFDKSSIVGPGDDDGWTQSSAPLFQNDGPLGPGSTSGRLSRAWRWR
jgi:hypothetical protein